MGLLVCVFVCASSIEDCSDWADFLNVQCAYRNKQACLLYVITFSCFNYVIQMVLDINNVACNIDQMQTFSTWLVEENKRSIEEYLKHANGCGRFFLFRCVCVYVTRPICMDKRKIRPIQLWMEEEQNVMDGDRTGVFWIIMRFLKLLQENKIVS